MTRLILASLVLAISILPLYAQSTSHSYTAVPAGRYSVNPDVLGSPGRATQPAARQRPLLDGENFGGEVSFLNPPHIIRSPRRCARAALVARRGRARRRSLNDSATSNAGGVMSRDLSSVRAVVPGHVAG